MISWNFPPSFQSAQSRPASGPPTDISERSLTREKQSTRLLNPIYTTEKIGKARMKIGKGNFHFRQGKGKMCSVNSESLSYLANLFFGFGTTFRSCPVLEKIGEAIKDGNRHVAGFMRCVNVHPCLEHVLWPYRARHKATAHACNEYSYKGMLLSKGKTNVCKLHILPLPCRKWKLPLPIFILALPIFSVVQILMGF